MLTQLDTVTILACKLHVSVEYKTLISKTYQDAKITLGKLLEMFSEIASSHVTYFGLLHVQ